MKFFSDAKNFSKSLLDKSHDRHVINSTILGGILFFSALGGVGTWGNLNIYFFSFFKKRANLSSPTQMNFILPIIAIPIALVSVFSIQIAEKVGFRKIIRGAALVYSLGTVLSSFSENVYVFTLLYSFLPGIALAFSMNPVIYCVWSCYPEIKGKISGYMFAVFQLSTLVYSLLGTMIINPENKIASEKAVDENNNVLNYYGEDVTKNMAKMVFVLGLIYFCLCVTASFLISPVSQAESKPTLAKTESPSQVEMSVPGNNKYEAFMEEKTAISSEKQIPADECPNVKTGIKTRTFAILFINSGLVAAFALYLAINFKTFSLTRINNDYYVTCLYVLNAIAGGVGRLFWGYIIDKYPFKRVLIILEIMVFINGLIFPFARSVVFYCIMLFSLAFFDGGLISIIGPGLMSIYGLNVGAKLLPIKALSFFIGLIICPVVGMMLEGKVGTEMVFLILGGLNVIGVVLAFFVKTKYNWYGSPKENEIN